MQTPGIRLTANSGISWQMIRAPLGGPKPLRWRAAQGDRPHFLAFALAAVALPLVAAGAALPLVLLLASLALPFLPAAALSPRRRQRLQQQKQQRMHFNVRSTKRKTFNIV